MRLIFARNANSSVGNANRNVLVVARNIHRHAATRRIFDGVFYEVLRNFAQMIVVDVCVKNRTESLGFVVARATFVRLVIQNKSFFGSLRRKSVDDILHKRHDIDNARIVLETMIVGLADIEQISEQPP